MRRLKLYALLTVALLCGATAPPPENELMVPGVRAGYVIAGPQGCWIWVGGVRAGALDIMASWDGACPEGQAEGPGRGELRWREGTTNRRMVFEGVLRRGRSEGEGRLSIYADGQLMTVMQGRFRDDRFAGGRVEIPATGLVYEGEWRLGHPHGPGKATVGSRVHEGQWANGCLRIAQGWVAFTRPAQECEERPT